MPLTGKTILCLASPWDHEPTSKHHVMTRLSRHNRVIWINYRGTRRPTLSGRDLKDIMRTLVQIGRGPRHAMKDLVHATPLIPPGASSAPLRWLHDRLLLHQLRGCLRRYRTPGSPLQIWSFAPDFGFLKGKFREELFLYYCVDDFAQFDDVDRRRIESLEEEMIEAADLIITTSAGLHDVRKPLHPRVHLVRHGVDWNHFSQAWRRNWDRPADLPANNRPTFGFFGLLHSWIDVPLIEAVARTRPRYNFVLIGRAKGEAARSLRLENISLLGRREYELLPRYCAHFTAGLMPFRLNRLTTSINPIKLREYLAAGLKVISTPIPEASLFRGPVRFAETVEQFAAACDLIVREGRSPEPSQIAEIVRDESWEAVLARLEPIVEATLIEKARNAPFPADDTAKTQFPTRPAEPLEKSAPKSKVGPSGPYSLAGRPASERAPSLPPP